MKWTNQGCCHMFQSYTQFSHSDTHADVLLATIQKFDRCTALLLWIILELCQYLHYIASDGTMISDWWIWKDFGRSSSALMRYPGGTEETSFNVPAVIQMEHLTNMRQLIYRCAHPLCIVVVVWYNNTSKSHNIN